MTNTGQAECAIAPQSVKQIAYELFQAALFEGKLLSGQLVSQKELVQLLHLSIGALRELLPRLESEGLITVVPKRGIQITTIDLPMIRDAFQMRKALEREAVISAVQHMPDAVLHEQKALHLDILEKLVADETDKTLLRGQNVDGAFHDLLINATGNEFLIQSYKINTIRIRLIRHDRISLNKGVLPSAYADHLTIINMILARDVAGTVSAIDQHIDNARQRAMGL